MRECLGKVFVNRIEVKCRYLYRFRVLSGHHGHQGVDRCWLGVYGRAGVVSGGSLVKVERAEG